ncbi:MAG: molybdate ABC transporter permease subunit [Candidatus Polarisedimenticolaceae bacterium]|nr:molybdate ABC transporter permease subunit [Candidatus Polarisedimenticolaceae bacterium]
MSEADIGALWVTLRLALITTIILLLLGTPLAWWLSRTQCRIKVLIEALVAIPLVLPPTVLGFYLLIMLAPDGPIGGLWQSLGGDTLAFSFSGLVIGSVLYSLPFVVQPLQNAFNNIGNHYLEAASTLRASPLNRFFTLVVPLAKPGFITATTLGFAHTVGEFGVVLMIGGNIPGETQVLSIAIYDHVESLEYANAHILSAGLLAFSLVVLVSVYSLNRQSLPNGSGR